jgi:O-antigen ligase
MKTFPSQPQLGAAFAGALPLTWLLSNHYPPWNSAWAEGLALFLGCAAALFASRRGALPRPWAAALLLALCSVVGHAALNRSQFAGDAAMAALYLVALGSCIAMGAALTQVMPNAGPLGDAQHGAPKPQRTPPALAGLAVMLVLCGLASVAIACIQWLNLPRLGFFMADLPPQGRPFANFAQPNHFCSACFLALVALLQLRQHRWVGTFGFSIVGACLAFGMVMSGSRTGWAQWVVLLAFTAMGSRRFKSTAGWREIGALTAFFVFTSVAWPAINDLVGRMSARPMADTLSGGTRLLHWQAMADAISREPLLGYGWNNASVAQTRVAADHPPVHEQLEHSHNILLDLLVWAGVPVGGAIIALLGFWFISRIRACQSVTALLWLLALAGLLAHGMLEYPLEYAFFLLPAGLMVGAVEALHPVQTAIKVPLGLLRAAGGLLCAAVTVVALDYLQAEQGFRTMRFETAGFAGTTVTAPPKLRVLDQLEAFQRFVQTEARPGMSPSEITWMRQVSERYAYPPAMLRYALATGLNGDPATATVTLTRLCRIQSKERCEEARQSWPALQAKYPQLASVPTP